jgi:hypothetical protein
MKKPSAEVRKEKGIKRWFDEWKQLRQQRGENLFCVPLCGLLS